MDNLLYYGDNLDILRQHVADESVDLIYLDPPFNSNQDYNVLFAEQDGSRSAAQIKAFGDTWRWDQGAVLCFDEAVRFGGRVAAAMQAFHTMLGPSDMLAYLAYMAPRLIELKRVLKDTGSIYLHCDPTASHYLKLLMDAIFGPKMFRNEIVWKRTTAHSSAKRWGPIHDIILFYAKTTDYLWKDIRQPYDQEYIDRFFARKHLKTAKEERKLTEVVSPSVMDLLATRSDLKEPLAKKASIDMEEFTFKQTEVKTTTLAGYIPTGESLDPARKKTNISE